MRERDLLFEAVLRVAGWEYAALTKSARFSLNAAVAELREVNATPDEVIVRGRRYWYRYPKRVPRRPSPPSLAKNWPSLIDISPLGAPAPEEGPCDHLYEEGDETDRYCVRCKTFAGAVQLRLIEGQLA
jgi:hypothetical protein